MDSISCSGLPISDGVELQPRRLELLRLNLEASVLAGVAVGGRRVIAVQELHHGRAVVSLHRQTARVSKSHPRTRRAEIRHIEEGPEASEHRTYFGQGSRVPDVCDEGCKPTFVREELFVALLHGEWRSRGAIPAAQLSPHSAAAAGDARGRRRPSRVPAACTTRCPVLRGLKGAGRLRPVAACGAGCRCEETGTQRLHLAQVGATAATPSLTVCSQAGYPVARALRTPSCPNARWAKPECGTPAPNHHGPARWWRAARRSTTPTPTSRTHAIAAAASSWGGVRRGRGRGGKSSRRSRAARPPLGRRRMATLEGLTDGTRAAAPTLPPPLVCRCVCPPPRAPERPAAPDQDRAETDPAWVPPGLAT
eukprot:scaffold889_cov379-Prasinococcus_capsulatus_cf.AAC.11